MTPSPQRVYPVICVKCPIGGQDCPDIPADHRPPKNCDLLDGPRRGRREKELQSRRLARGAPQPNEREVEDA